MGKGQELVKEVITVMIDTLYRHPSTDENIDNTINNY